MYTAGKSENMKMRMRFLAIFLALINICAVLSGCAASGTAAPPFPLYGAKRLWYSCEAFSASGGVILDESDEVRCVASGNVVFSSSILGVDTAAFPFMRVCCDGDVTRADIAFFTRENNVITERARTELALTTAEDGVIIPLGSAAAEENDAFCRVTLYQTEADSKLAVRCAAFLPTEEQALAFKADDYSGYINSYDGKEINYAEADEATVSGYLDAADERIAAIRSAEGIDPATVKGTCYYVSSVNGNDENDGLTPETAWQSIERLMEHSHKNEEGLICSDLLPGDAVFFERGSLFRGAQHTNESGDYTLPLCYGVTYSAYGEGEKPEFRNSYDASSPDDWEATEYENIWVYTGNLKTKLYSKKKPDPFVGDIGNIIFDNGAAWGIKVVPGDMSKVYSDEKPTVNCSTVTNGIEVFHTGDVILSNPGCIENNLEFLHNHLYNKLYLRCNEGNPGECFNSIELSRRGDIIRDFYYEVKNDGADEVGTVIDNLCLSYCGGGAIGTWGASNLTVQNCEMGWIGGSFQDPAALNPVRFGNAVQNWNECDGIYCRNNYIYQCYDAGLSTQGTTGVMRNIIFENNVISHTNYAIELFNTYSVEENGERTGCIDDITVSGNYLLYSGYGFGHQRPDKNGCHFRVVGGAGLYKNAVFEDNICLYSTLYTSMRNPVAYSAETGDGPVFRRNVYVADTNRSCFLRGWSDVKQREDYSPYSERYIRYFANTFGTEDGSTFYYITDPLSPEETSGLYR